MAGIPPFFLVRCEKERMCSCSEYSIFSPPIHLGNPIFMAERRTEGARAKLKPCGKQSACLWFVMGIVKNTQRVLRKPYHPLCSHRVWISASLCSYLCRRECIRFFACILS